jgi:hypothetical protein
MLNSLIAGASAFSLAFCVYAAGWGGACGAGHHSTVGAGDSCCELEPVSAGPEVCTHCEAEARHEAEMQVLLADVAATAPATAPAGEDMKNTKCLISGEAIGSMGEGEAVAYKGKVYHFCCSDCVKTFNKDPEKYVKAFDADRAKWGAPKK